MMQGYATEQAHHIQPLIENVDRSRLDLRPGLSTCKIVIMPRRSAMASCIREARAEGGAAAGCSGIIGLPSRLTSPQAAAARGAAHP